MTREQEIFYARVGRVLTDMMKQKNISIGEIKRISGEQDITIRRILNGKCCSLHHMVWMRNILGINLNEIISNDTEGSHGEAEGIVDVKIEDII
jgi:hypothetical protein